MRTIAFVLLLSAAGTAMATGSVQAADHTNKNHQNQTTQTKPQVQLAASVQPQTYTVGTGDSLSSIAASKQLPSWRPLWNANTDLQNPDEIQVGEKLVVPTGPTTDRPLPAGYGEPIAAPVAAPASSPAAAGVSVTPNYGGGADVGGLFARIRQRESGGNYAENTGNGYYGAYQFSLGTWRSVGGSGNPADASPAEQDMRAQLLYNQRGCSPWPQTCH